MLGFAEDPRGSGVPLPACELQCLVDDIAARDEELLGEGFTLDAPAPPPMPRPLSPGPETERRGPQIARILKSSPKMRD